jgi:hypothetical protein
LGNVAVNVETDFLMEVEMDIGHWNIYVSWVVTALVGAFGIGVGYAVLKTDLSSFKREFQLYVHSAAAASAAAAMLAGDQLTGVKARVSKIEDKIDSQVGYGRCKDMRGECNERIISQLQEMARQISNNRDTVISQMRETEKFIGRVEQHLIKNGG